MSNGTHADKRTRSSKKDFLLWWFSYKIPAPKGQRGMGGRKERAERNGRKERKAWKKRLSEQRNLSRAGEYIH